MVMMGCLGCVGLVVGWGFCCVCCVSKNEKKKQKDKKKDKNKKKKKKLETKKKPCPKKCVQFCELEWRPLVWTKNNAGNGPQTKKISSKQSQKRVPKKYRQNEKKK